MPPSIASFLDFAQILRAHRFAVSPDQTIGWIEAIGLLGPRSIGDVRAAAVALMAIPREREDEFDALFQSHFHGMIIAAATSAPDDEDVDAYEPTGATAEVEEADDEREAGAEATAVERLARRTLGTGDDDALRHFARHAPQRLPRRRSYRRAPARRGDAPDMRRALREAVRRDGEVLYLPQQRRKLRQRRILLLIDISGSMKERSDSLMRFGHALARASDRFEAFTLGTRLTRVTAALKTREEAQALERVGSVVADFDGGTRLGEALQALLAVPRYAGFARGAAVVVLSDGLERGDPTAMVDAVGRLSRMAWRLVWLSPLAGREGYQPETAGMVAILPELDRLDDGASLDAICRHVLTLARAA